MPTTPHTRLTNVISPLMRTPQLNFLLVADSSIWRPPLNMGQQRCSWVSALPIHYRRNGCLGPGCLLRTVLHDCDGRTRNVSVSATTICIDNGLRGRNRNYFLFFDHRGGVSQGGPILAEVPWHQSWWGRGLAPCPLSSIYRFETSATPVTAKRRLWWGQNVEGRGSGSGRDYGFVPL